MCCSCCFGTPRRGTPSVCFKAETSNVLDFTLYNISLNSSAFIAHHQTIRNKCARTRILARTFRAYVHTSHDIKARTAAAMSSFEKKKLGNRRPVACSISRGASVLSPRPRPSCACSVPSPAGRSCQCQHSARVHLPYASGHLFSGGESPAADCMQSSMSAAADTYP